MRSSRPRLLLLAILSACFLATTSVSTPGQAAGQSVAQAVPQLPSNWNDAVQSLAAKIANLAGHDRNISLEVRNISSLTSADDAAIRQSLESELTRRRFRLLESSQAEAQVVVTLSENVDSYIWVSQVHTDSADHVAIIAVTKTNAASSPNTLTGALALEKNLIWQQPASFLDFAFVGASDASASTLAILEPDRLEYYFADFMSAHSVTWRAGPSVPIPHSTRWPRDLRGSIDQDKGEVQVANVRCTGSLAEPDTMQCAAQAPPLEPQTEIKVSGHEDSETASLSGRCGDQFIVLSTDNGDWTQPDSIQGYLSAESGQNMQNARPSGDPLRVDGPVISLLPGPQQNVARAVVHNLKTGNYEAYVITANCAH